MKKYFEIYSEIKSGINKGEYKRGEKLPSKRVLADKYGCSLITVERAYSMLDDEGYIYSRERRGYFVSDIDAHLVRAESDAARPFAYLEEERAASCELEYSLFFKSLRKVISEKGERLFTSSPSEGCAVLRNAIASYLYRYRKMVAEPSNIIIGSGAEQLYEIAARLLGRDKKIGVEDPCYKQIISVYMGMGKETVPLKMGESGILSSELSEKEFDLLHVTPFHSYPSGVTADIQKRLEYLRISAERGIYIIEDDFDSEFFMPGHPIETLYSLSVGNVIYINTFSKSLSPSMRMGYMILPDLLLERYKSVFGGLSCSVPVIDQYVIAEFIESGYFERHLNKMRRKMKK